MDEKQISDILSLFLFQLMSPDELLQVNSIFTEKVYVAGFKVFFEHQKGDTMYVVKSGSVKITKKIDSQEKDIATMGPGDFFGEIAVFDYAFRTANAIIAEEGTILLEISRAKFNETFEKKPQVMAKLLYQMLTEMSRRLRRKTTSGDNVIF
jgi:CRP/FNR family transcriptional regulator, cyclic AMP receptor protein